MGKVNTLKYANDEYVKILLNSFLEKSDSYANIFNSIKIKNLSILELNLFEILSLTLITQFDNYKVQEILLSKSTLEDKQESEMFLKLTTIYLRELDIIDAEKEVNINEMNFDLKVPIIMSLVKDNILFTVGRNTPF